MVESAAPAFCRLVTVNARDGDMTAGKHEAGLLMACEVESRRVERGLVVALLATVEVGSARELVVVYVLMAGDAPDHFDFEYGGAAQPAHGTSRRTLRHASRAEETPWLCGRPRNISLV